jgi:hypothetical protein
MHIKSSIIREERQNERTYGTGKERKGKNQLESF